MVLTGTFEITFYLGMHISCFHSVGPQRLGAVTTGSIFYPIWNKQTFLYFDCHVEIYFLLLLVFYFTWNSIPNISEKSKELAQLIGNIH